MKQIQNQYIDIPMKIQDTPHYLLQRASQFQFPETPMETAADLLSRLQQAIKKQNANELYILQTVYFPKADAQKFPTGDWPKPSKLQQIQQRDFSTSSQVLYSQLILRKKFDRVKSNEAEFIDTVQQCWDTYTSIFEFESTRIKFPPLLIWEFMENFSYQFSQYHFRLQTLPAEKINQQWFNVNKTYEILNKLSKYEGNASSTLEFFKHYSVIIHATIQAYFGQFQNVIKTISNIKYTDLIYYSKAFGSIIHLFLTASYSHFMINQYNEAACLCELVLSFYQKHKKYLQKAADRHLVRNHERIVGLLSIVYIFLQEQPKNEIMQIFRNTAVRTKEKQYKQKISDKYHKLRQHDYNSFMKLFNFSSLPLIGPRTQVDERQKEIYNRFEKLKEINLNVIIHNYKQIPIDKLAKILKISKEQVMKQIEQFNKIERGQTAWSSTILFPLLKQKRKPKLQINEDILRIEEENELQQEQAWNQYRQEIMWLTKKVQMI